MKKLSLHLFYCFISTIVVASCIPKEKTALHSTPQVIDSLFVDSVTSDFPVSFSFINTPSHQVVAYYNKTRNLTLASREITQKKWDYKTLPTQVGWDSHNRITMTLDRDSCIHVTGNMHNDSMTYFVSQKPLDVLSLKKIFPMVNTADELSSTYPGFIKLGDGSLVFSYRKGGSGNGITISNVYDEKTKAFSRLTDQPLFDGQNKMSAYASGPRMGPDGWFHVVWLWRNTPHSETNHHLSYARSKDLVNWECADGNAIALPITPEKEAFTVDPTGPGGGMINGAFRLFFDTQKKPIIAYMKYDNNGNNQLYLARYNTTQWQINQITDWDYRWEFKGPGSITFEIRINGASIDKHIASIAYSHKHLGNGRINVDLTTLTALSDEKVEAGPKQSSYPEELLKYQSGMSGAQIHWIKKTNPLNTDEYYALRWETLGKRRFYKAPEKPIKATPLMLYTIAKSGQ